jgi:hypothetical protein
LTKKIESWIKPEDQMPPRHVKLLFLDVGGKIWQGDMCYGMHEPWFCTHHPNGCETFILNDHRVRIVGWMELETAMNLLDGPKNSS